MDTFTKSNKQNGNAKIGTEQLIGVFMGHDIIGWDMDGFHSYICNSLLQKLVGIIYNETGLIVNEYDEVKKMANSIQGLGEPVNWFPCKIYKYSESIV